MNQQFELNHHLENSEVSLYQQLVKKLKNTPIPDNEILANIGLFFNRSSMARTLFFDDLYKQIINSHGVVMEFGVRWGQTLNILLSLRSMYEPYNISRKIIGFDTFSGFPTTSKEDGDSSKVQVGNYAVSTNYKDELEDLLQLQESLNPKAAIKKFELVEGDVLETLPSYLEKHQETVISLVYFDLDLYLPTKKCLEAILPYCHQGTIFAFDELCYEDFPGETQAFREVFAGLKYQVFRSPTSPQQSYVKLL